MPFRLNIESTGVSRQSQAWWSLLQDAHTCLYLHVLGTVHLPLFHEMQIMSSSVDVLLGCARLGRLLGVVRCMTCWTQRLECGGGLPVHTPLHGDPLHGNACRLWVDGPRCVGKVCGYKRGL